MITASAGAKPTFNILLAHHTRVSQLEDTKQLAPAPPAELPPRCPEGAGEERSDSPGDADASTRCRIRAPQGWQWHTEDRKLVGRGLWVQRVSQAVTGISKWKPGTGFQRGKVRPSTPGLTGVGLIFEGRREMKHFGREVEVREWRFGARQVLCLSELSQQGRSEPTLRKLRNY